MKKIVVPFPKSQILGNKDGFFEHCELINSDVGVNMYGACAYLVDEDWYNDVKSGKVGNVNYTKKDEKRLIINNSYPICF